MTGSGSTEHPCPGGCGAQVPRHQLACKPCWFRLPGALRAAVGFAYRRRVRDPGPHREALATALQWYRTNPIDPSGGSS